MASGKLNSYGEKSLVSFMTATVIQTALFYGAVGTFRIAMANAYVGVTLISAIVGIFIMWRITPELANARGETRGDTKPWDRVLLPIFLLLSGLVTPIIAGLDVGRYRWSIIHDTGSILAAYAFYILALALLQWAMIANRHFEGTVRIQSDRGHRVVAAGPYRFIRHPGYLAMIVHALATPLMIGSAYGLIPAGVAVAIMVARTGLEDRTLREELDGYADYATRVRYRLLPWVW